MAHGSEHALVVRRARTLCAAQLEGYRAGVVVCGDGLRFLMGVDLSLRAETPAWLVRQAGGPRRHLESQEDVGREHRKQAQHKLSAKLRKPRGYQPSVRVFCAVSWARLYPHSAPARVWSALSHKSSRE